MGLITLGNRTAGSPLSVRAITVKLGPHIGTKGPAFCLMSLYPGAGDVQKNAFSDSKLSSKTFLMLLGPNHTQPAVVDFF